MEKKDDFIDYKINVDDVYKKSELKTEINKEYFQPKILSYDLACRNCTY